MKQAPCYGFWTEHEGTVDAPPISAELSTLEPGRTLTGSSPWSVHVLRGIYVDYEGAKAAQNEMHTLGWDAWLALWKQQVERKERRAAEVETVDPDDDPVQPWGSMPVRP